MNQSFWDEQAKLPGLRAVIDPNDVGTHKNAYLDRLHKTVLARHGVFRKKDRVLDFGCGYGRIASWLAPRVASVHGTDANRQMIRRAAAELRTAGTRNVSVVPYDGREIPFCAGAFSKVVSVWVIQHILDDEEGRAILGELARVTRPGGRLLFIERVADTPIEPWMPPNTITRRRADVYRRLFSASGLECEVAYPICDGAPIWHRRRMNGLVTSGRIPRPLFRAIIEIDLLVRRWAPAGDWSDYVFGCVKP